MLNVIFGIKSHRLGCLVFGLYPELGSTGHSGRLLAEDVPHFVQVQGSGAGFGLFFRV